MLNNIITTVVRREGKISLPSIGILVKADFDGDTTYLFTPSAAKQDSNMVAVIVSEMGVNAQEASNILDSYIDFIKSVIAKNGRYHIAEIGYILRNSSDVYYFMPLGAPHKETIIEEVRQEILDNEVVVEEVEDNGAPAPVAAPLQEESAERLNERFQSKRLGEIIDGGSNKRFYDQVHSQVVSTANEAPVSTIITEETTTVKRKGLYDIYDKGLVKKEVKQETTTAASASPYASVYSQPAVEVAPSAPIPTPVPTPAPTSVFSQSAMSQPKKKADMVLIISIIVIIVGLAFIGYFYFLQQSMELELLSN